MRRRWAITVVAATFLAAIATAVSGVALNVATGGDAAWFPTMEDHPLRWLAASATAVAVAGVLVWWAQQGYEQSLVTSVPATQRPEPWVVDRPREMAGIVRALRFQPGATTVGITTAVHGAGGFGKTTVARLVRAHPRVLRRFGRRIHWVTLGRDVRRGALVEKVNDLVRQIDPARAQPFTDVRQAADHLASVLADGPRRLIVLDDVWFPDQLATFPVAGRCARLVTTRNPSLVEHGVPVKVDQMSPEQARRVLTADLPGPLPNPVIDRFLVETGNWPLLLRLVNKILLDQARSRPDLAAVAQDLLARLRRDGALEVDELSGASSQTLDVNDPEQREKAVRATIEASTGLLSEGEHRRFAQLAIFAEDESVPVRLVAALWEASEIDTAAWCARLADLALVTLSPADGGRISLHDVIRDYLAKTLTHAARLHRRLLDAVHTGPWWELPDTERYLRDHLIEHLLAAGRRDEAEALALDLRWILTRLEDAGPAAPAADLAPFDSPRATRLKHLLAQADHLLGPAQPAHACADILLDRVANDRDWGGPAKRIIAARTTPRLVSTWPLPDLPSSRLLRTLAGHDHFASALAVTPDGDTVVAADHISVLTWDAATGRLRTKVDGGGTVQALAPDGATFVARSLFGTVTLRSTLTGRQLARIGRRLWRLNEVAIAPDNSWLATLTFHRFVRIWDTTTGRQRSSLGNLFSIRHLAVSPDSTRIATFGSGYAVQLWDAATGRRILGIPTPSQFITTVAITPDGSGLATGDIDGTVHIRDTATGRVRATGPRHEGWIDQIAVSGDGAWIATAGHDRTIRVWNLADVRRGTVLHGHLRNVRVVALAPDGSWLVSGSEDATIRVWDNRTRTDRVPTSSGTPVAAMALAANGTCLVIARSDYGVRFLDPRTGGETAAISRKSPAVAAAPNGDWVAIADGSDVLLWDVGADKPRARLHSHREDYARPPGRPPVVHRASIRAVAVSPDGAWIAIADDHVVTVHKVSTGLEQCHFALVGRLHALKFAPDGSWLATAADNGTIRTWDTRSGLQRTRVRSRARHLSAFTTTPDGDLLLIAGRFGGVFATGVADKRIGKELTGHPDQPSAMAVTPDGRWVAGCSASGAVWIWDFHRGPVVAMTRVDGNLIACAWSPDGRHLYAGGSSGPYRFEFRDRPA
ncbi:WD-repeat protein [Micromonospora sp. ATCC 39149]|uniref:NB-ARC domain-containing protein n=1 Tax=Micromonospora carbonacea TaxID=47853 RepID=A0A7D6CE04_9ACTN|nr:NB-ARC domain-containing protein [Micromonospora sp. ATCC 39149]EEP74703.1 WD-repeat protein [Micromonospora sp. ATCC 39149]QLK00504.1 hypothetical protein HZU44_10980 [Micromonospora carbonacea]